MKKLISILLILCLTAALFTGCQSSPPAQTVSPRAEIKPLSVDLSNAADIGLSSFDSRLIEFLKQTGKANENFAVSPLSFKAALALAASGAEGETLDQLLSVMGFSSREEMDAWYQTVLANVDQFAKFTGNFGQDGRDAYQIVNSIWQNTAAQGEFLESYRKLVEEIYRAEAYSEAAERITAAVNAWVNEKTNGLIPQIIGNAADSAAILVNAIYLKAAWLDQFHESEQTEFTTAAGSTVQKPFMEQTHRYRYYEDEVCQIVVLELDGGISMALVLGDDTGFSAKLNRTESRKVRVVMPKFEVETSFDQRELCSFLATSGCEKIFRDSADFSSMFTAPIYVDDIIQKAKVKVDEEGLEAAAATAIITKNAAALDTEEPALFLADRPFTFYVFNGEEAPELLFWGQILN